jgi:hypothetical protein
MPNEKIKGREMEEKMLRTEAALVEIRHIKFPPPTKTAGKYNSKELFQCVGPWADKKTPRCATDLV